MRTNIDKLRENHLVSAALLQIEPKLRLISSDSTIIDFFAELPVDEAKFAVITWPARDLHIPAFAELVSNVESSLDSLDGHPVILACYDEAHGLLIDYLVRWDFGESKIIPTPMFKPLTNENKNAFFHFVRLQDAQIRILKDGYHKVVKTINFNVDRNGIKCNAQMVYLRDFTPNYKMNPKPVENYEERFYRNLNVQPQDEYPHDFLDDSILSAVQKVYPDAKVVNSLLVTNSEYRNLLLYRNQQKEFAEFRFFPDLSDIPVELYPKLGRIEGAKIRVDIFLPMRINKNAFANEGFDLGFPLEGWFDTLNKIVNQLQTMHSVSSMIEQ